MQTYEDWLESMSDEERETAYMTGGSDDDVGLMLAYHIQNIEQTEAQYDEAKKEQLLTGHK